MTARQRRPMLLLFAAMAFAGMASVGVPAKACAEVAAPKACCAAGPAADCRCCGPVETATPLLGVDRPEGMEWSASSTTLEAPRTASSCECRAQTPAAPARKSDSRSADESRSDQGRAEAVAYLAPTPRVSPPASRLASANASPPKSPLYLRTLHLLV